MVSGKRVHLIAFVEPVERIVREMDCELKFPYEGLGPHLLPMLPTIFSSDTSTFHSDSHSLIGIMHACWRFLSYDSVFSPRNLPK